MRHYYPDKPLAWSLQEKYSYATRQELKQKLEQKTKVPEAQNKEHKMQMTQSGLSLTANPQPVFLTGKQMWEIIKKPAIEGVSYTQIARELSDHNYKAVRGGEVTQSRVCSVALEFGGQSLRRTKRYSVPNRRKVTKAAPVRTEAPPPARALQSPDQGDWRAAFKELIQTKSLTVRTQMTLLSLLTPLVLD